MRLQSDSRARLVRDRERGWLVVKQGDVCLESERLRQFSQLAYEPGRPASLPVWCYDTGSELARHFVPGRSLRELLRQGPLAARRVERWIAALARLLEPIHRAGCCHGDISAGNVLLTPAGELVLLDWGGGGRVTPAYSAPELRGGATASAAQDVYALGMLWLQALLGGLPENPPAQTGLLQDCLHPDPARRPSVAQLAALDEEPELFSNCLGRTRSLSQFEEKVRQLGERHAVWLALPAPSGSGKSEFLRELCAHQPAWAWGQGSTLRSPSSFGIFQGASRAPALADPPIANELLETARWQLLLQVFPALRAGREVRQGVAGALATQALVAAWTELLQLALTRLGRLLLVVDDAQWMDASSQQLLQELSHQDLPGLTVIVAWREEEWTPPAEIRFHAQLELEPLNLDGLEQWLRRDGVALNDLDLASLHSWSQGLPLLLRYWISQDGSHSKVGLLLEERIEQLSAEESEILRVAALLGKSFLPGPLEALFPTASQALRKGVQLQLLLPPLEETNTFVHKRIRGLILKELSEEERRDIHRRLAEHYLKAGSEGVTESAHHLAQAGEMAQAAPLALQAARQEVERLAFDSARKFYEIYFSQPHELAVWLEYRVALVGLNELAQAREKLDQALAQCSDSRQRLEFLEALSELGFDLCEFHMMREYALQCRQIGGVRGIGLYLYYNFVWAIQNVDERAVNRSLPAVMAYCLVFGKRAPVLAATVANGLDQRGLYRWTRPWYRKLLACYDRAKQPGPWGQIRARECTYLFSTPDGLREHLATLRELEKLLEGNGVAFEFSIILLMIGYYAICQGQFQELLRLARRLGALAEQMGGNSFSQVALHFEVEARGGSFAWAPLARALQAPAERFLGHAHLVVASAQVCLRRGRPEQAWHYLNLIDRYGAVYDNGMVLAQRATVARVLVEKTPRSRAALREQYLNWGVTAAEDCIKTSKLMRPYLAQGQREHAWLLLAQGEEGRARQLFAESAEEARRYGSTYQEALSRLAWGQCGWEESPQQLQLGRDLLRSLGAWWELDQQPDLPLDDLGEAAKAYLVDRQSDALVALGGSALVAELDRLLEERRLSIQRLGQEQLRLQGENDIWEKFLRNGPIVYERRDSRGQLLEGSPRARVAETAARVQLPDGSVAALELPVQRWSFHQLDEVLRLERSMLSRQITRDVADLDGEVAAEWRRLPEPNELGAGVDWTRLDALSAQTLRAVLREVESNSRKHGRGPLQASYTVEGNWLVGHFQQERGEGGAGTGFGSEGMRFRLAQVGGELATRLDEKTYSMSLRMALSPQLPG